MRVTFREIAAISRAIWHEDHPPVMLAGLCVLDLREDRNIDHDQVEAVFAEAVSYLQQPAGEYFHLVQSNIRQITICDVTRESVVWWSRTLNTALPGSHRRSTFYLACRLVWNASYLDTLSKWPFMLRPFYKKVAYDVAGDEWLRFVEQFPGSEEWQNYLRSHK
jgi:hypothetical protein